MKPPTNNNFLQMTLNYARRNPYRHRHAALVVKHGHPLALAHNLPKNLPTTPGIPRTALSTHAEARALKQARFPRKATVYVARALHDNTPGNSAPCQQCQALIDSLDCKVVHT